MEKLFGCIDDKGLVVIALTIIGCWAMVAMGVEAKEIIISIVSGMCGIAVGKALNS